MTVDTYDALLKARYTWGDDSPSWWRNLDVEGTGEGRRAWYDARHLIRSANSVAPAPVHQGEHFIWNSFDEARYKAVVECCALGPDLKMLEDGDQTEIGARGVSLSGGQKARYEFDTASYRVGADVSLPELLLPERYTRERNLFC